MPGSPTPPESTPGGQGGKGGERRSRGTRWVLVATALAVVLVLVAVGALVLRQRDQDVAEQGPSAGAVSSGAVTPSAAPTTGGAGSPDAAPATPTAAPTSTGSPDSSGTAAPSTAPVDCPVGDPLTRQPHPEDGLVHGGGLSFPPPAGWVTDRRAAALSWAYDVGEADQQVRGTWYTGAAVGAVSVVDAPDLRDAAELMMGCTASPSFYTGLTSRTDLVDEAGELDGSPAWTIRSEIRMDNPYVPVPGDVVEVTVVDLGSGESFAFFWGTAPLDDPTLVAQLDTLAQQVQVG